MTGATTERSNQQWCADLASDGVRRERALAELRAYLMRALRGALASRRDVDMALIEDATQEAMMKILEKLDQFQGRARFLTWASSIAVRTALSNLRRKSRSDVSLEQWIADERNATHEVLIDPDVSVDIADDQQRLFRVLSDQIQTVLTEKQRVAILAELAGKTQDEIAEHFQSNRNAIYKLTHDARKRLRKALESAGFSGGDIAAAFSP